MVNSNNVRLVILGLRTHDVRLRFLFSNNSLLSTVEFSTLGLLRYAFLNDINILTNDADLRHNDFNDTHSSTLSPLSHLVRSNQYIRHDLRTKDNIEIMTISRTNSNVNLQRAGTHTSILCNIANPQ